MSNRFVKLVYVKKPALGQRVPSFDALIEGTFLPEKWHHVVSIAESADGTQLLITLERDAP